MPRQPYSMAKKTRMRSGGIPTSRMSTMKQMMRNGKMVQSEQIIPDWPAPANVKAWQTTRSGGYSQAPYDTLNFGDHVGDDPLAVAKNRQTLRLPSEPVWLQQMHGTKVVLAEQADCSPQA